MMDLLELTLNEDCWRKDRTALFCLKNFGIDANQSLKFKIVSRGDGVFSGSSVVDELGRLEASSFRILDFLVKVSQPYLIAHGVLL